MASFEDGIQMLTLYTLVNGVMNDTYLDFELS